MATNSVFDLSKCARPNILALVPYHCARDDYEDNGRNILLDANENAFGSGLPVDIGITQNGDDPVEVDLQKLNRYPDPHQIQLKKLLCDLRNSESQADPPLSPSNLFVGSGSDEAIDSLIRCFCVPQKDKILTCPPTYGMYAVSAQINDVELVRVPLHDDFSLDAASIVRTISADPTIKIMFLCSPGNPTGTLLSLTAIESLLQHPTWNGVVVIDEAYIDFSPSGTSAAPLVTRYPNLVVMQTMSKAFGLAGIRLGAAFTSAPIARLLNAMKAPYNVSSTTSALAQLALKPVGLANMRAKQQSLLKQRDRLRDEILRIPGVGRLRGGEASNFLLFEFLDGPEGKPSNPVALGVYEQLAECEGVVVRFRGKEQGCPGCLRITIGTEEEMNALLSKLPSVLERVWYKLSMETSKSSGRVEENKEDNANGVIA